jgi:hypothetical protein
MDRRIEFIKRFMSGDQNIGYSEDLGIAERMKSFWWQSDDCFNLFPAIQPELLKVSDEEEMVEIVMQLAPYQYKYNKFMNIVSELADKLACPPVMVEDGSLDVGDLEEEGLCPGKVVIYRQGCNQPMSTVEVKPEAVAIVSEQPRIVKLGFYELAETLLANAVSNKGEGLKKESV